MIGNDEFFAKREFDVTATIWILTVTMNGAVVST